MPPVRISSKRLSAFLKLDCFGERQTIRYAGDLVEQDIIPRPVFFKRIYTGVQNGKIHIHSGFENEYREIEYNTWIRDIIDALPSHVIFIEGYAGCGKSVFVQKILTEVFPNYDYDRNYYNYDIGYTYENNRLLRIRAAILECFINQYIRFMETGHEDIIEKMEKLLADEAIGQLDNSKVIYYDFTGTKAYADAKRCLVELHDVKNFKDILHVQLKNLTTEQVIYIDVIMRLARYLKIHEEPEAQIICYDNLDAIENNEELCIFDNVLLTVKDNIDSYMQQTRENYTQRGAPHFVFIATFRKITAVIVGLHNNSERYAERYEDNSHQFENVYYIDGSQLFDYKEMIISRLKYLEEYIANHDLGDTIGIVANQMNTVIQLFDTSFVHSRFSGLWNNNYRTCSEIMERIIQGYEPDVRSCINMTKQKNDSYDEFRSVPTGASAVFLSIICNVQHACGYWGDQHLAINSLTSAVPKLEELNRNTKLVKTLTSLSRLILTYINNAAELESRSVSTTELFDVFSGVFTVDDIATVLSNMLSHERNGTWRRPIVYANNPIPIGAKIDDAIRLQGLVTKNPPSHKRNEPSRFTEITTCECGQSFVTRISCDYEYYSVRLGYTKSLYLVEDVDKVIKIFSDIYNAVKICCEKMILFKEYYCSHNKTMSGLYINQLFHPRTYKKQPQLHTERVIFSHIAYLEEYRRHVALSSTRISDTDKPTLIQQILFTIGNYLQLYDVYTSKVDKKRLTIVQEMKEKLKSATNNPFDDSIRIRVEDFADLL